MKLRINRRTELALRALRLLEVRGEKLQASEMARELRASAQYLPQVLRPLVHSGWLTSDRGPTGGYLLASPLTDRSLLELIQLIEGPIEDRVCVLRDGRCGEAECAMHIPWLEAQRAVIDRLSAVLISLEPLEEGAGS